tara:strand:- start:403 stop:552 length:150 start_codon:yes stop_codon:yes gene_type:complete
MNPHLDNMLFIQCHLSLDESGRESTCIDPDENNSIISKEKEDEEREKES